MDYKEALDQFVQTLHDREKARVAAKDQGKPARFRVDEGRMYDKVVRESGYNKRPGGGSVFCFIKKHPNAAKGAEVGDILKAASWKAPAKHSRGSIFNENQMEGVGAYGATYLT